MENTGGISINGPGVNTVQTNTRQKWQPISIASINPGFISCRRLPCDRDGAGRGADTLRVSIWTLMEQAPGEECNYGLTSVSQTVMHIDESALWPWTCTMEFGAGGGGGGSTQRSHWLDLSLLHLCFLFCFCKIGISHTVEICFTHTEKKLKRSINKCRNNVDSYYRVVAV